MTYLDQGWAAVWGHQRREGQAAFVFEVADWAVDRQLDKSGAFLEDLSPQEPSSKTGSLAEGLVGRLCRRGGAGRPLRRVMACGEPVHGHAPGPS